METTAVLCWFCAGRRGLSTWAINVKSVTKNAVLNFEMFIFFIFFVFQPDLDILHFSTGQHLLTVDVCQHVYVLKGNFR